jgi:hypothetical protein
MGTNGAMVFVVEGERKEQYVHNDSYPEGLGVDVLKWLRKSWEDPAVHEAARNLKPIPVDHPDPTVEEQTALAKYTDLGVSGQSLFDWYCLLRRCQGDPALTLEAGYVYGDAGAATYTYKVDFDAKTFTASDWGGEVFGTWSFADLPKKKAFLKACSQDEYDD